jgi:hypothetical protein
MAHSQILLLLANQWKHAHHMILSLTFKDQTTHSGTANSWWNFPVQSGIHTSCLSESSNIGLGHFRHMDKEEHTNRFIVQDLVEGHFTFINTYQCWKATSGLSRIKQNIDGTALARNTYFFTLRWGYLRVVNICLWTYLGIWRRKLAKGKLWIPRLCVFSCKARSMCMV